MPTTYELKICGHVQHVGFRDRIEDIGRGLGIDGVVYNYKDGTVRILANFDDEELKEAFKYNIKLLGKKDKLITIKEIEERELNTFIEFPKGINRISSDDLVELNKKLDEGVKYIKMIFGEMEKMNVILDSMNNKVDNMDNKLDEIVKILKKINEKL
jgi:acylphosphatase